MVSADRRFADLGNPSAVWAVGAIHADRDRLAALHTAIDKALEPGDRLVYLGNMVGYGREAIETLNEIIGFRARKLDEGLDASHLIYLRGMQEEMWQKLLQLQFAPNPDDVLKWMIDHGLKPTVEAYGGKVDEGIAAARTGVTNLNRWTATLRAAMHRRDGHDGLFSTLRRAAFTSDSGLLLVSAGLDPNRPLANQGDSLWWGHTEFERLSQPIEGFRRIVRGFDPNNGGPTVGKISATIDGGCGRGGKLMAARLSPSGEVTDTIEV